MADELIDLLTRFHRDVVMPDVREAMQTEIGSLRGEMLSHFDAIYKRFDRLETEYQAIKAAVIRLEARMASLEETLKVEIRHEIDEIKARIAQLQERVAELESQL